MWVLRCSNKYTLDNARAERGLIQLIKIFVRKPITRSVIKTCTKEININNKITPTPIVIKMPLMPKRLAAKVFVGYRKANCLSHEVTSNNIS